MSSRPRRPIWLFLALAVMVFLGGCSTFERDWNARTDLGAAADSPDERLATRLEGRWHGTWTSTKSGHSGTLRCIITPRVPQASTLESAPPENAIPDSSTTEDSTPAENADASDSPDSIEETNTYLARFHATFWGTFTFEYDLIMNVRREGETCHFSSEADLGWLAGGRYEYVGTVVGDEFQSAYSCKGDYGTFEMRRVD